MDRGRLIRGAAAVAIVAAFLVFVLRNNNDVTVDIFSFDQDVSLIWLMLTSCAVGLLIGALMMMRARRGPRL